MRLTVTLAANGLDVAIEDVPGNPSPEVRERSRARRLPRKLARVTIAGDTLYQSTIPAVRFGDANVVLPPRAFLQAAPAAEAEMVRLVTAAVGSAKRVADLFCGLGTFTFPLAKRCSRARRRRGQPGNRSAANAAKRTPGLKPIETKSRDLFREPLSGKELESFDAVVFDPPRAGAAAQASRSRRLRFRRLSPSPAIRRRSRAMRAS